MQWETLDLCSFLSSNTFSVLTDVEVCNWNGQEMGEKKTTSLSLKELRVSFSIENVFGCE